MTRGFRVEMTLFHLRNQLVSKKCILSTESFESQENEAPYIRRNDLYGRRSFGRTLQNYSNDP